MNDELIAEAELGEQARAFLESDLGKCLVGMAQQEVALAQEALETVEVTDYPKIRDLQNRAWRGRQFEQWLAELVSKGEQAIEVFKQQKGE